MKRTVIIGTGHYLPEVIVKNEDFLNNEFYSDDQVLFEAPNEEIIKKFQAITHIEERRYAKPEQNCSDLAFLAAERALKDSGIDPESLDYIIGASNFGNVFYGELQSQFMPSMAARVKHSLRIKNPKTVAYDMLFGCPGWVEAFIQAHAFINAGMAKRVLVFGSELLSRVMDPNDRDGMIFGDGAGAVVIEAQESDEPIGLLSHNTLSFTYDEAYYLEHGTTNKPNTGSNGRYLKMKGRKIYEFALTNVPVAIRSTIEDAGLDISDIDKVLIHQANEKMDQAIVKRLYKSYGIKKIPDSVMPMTIAKFGNSSVATIPTMLDLILKGQLGDHSIKKGDTVVMTSVGAGMHINAFVYRF